jgi:hypothetical protein
MDRPEFHRLADRELNEAAQYYDLESPGLGSSFLEEVDRCLQSIQDHPEAGMILRVRPASPPPPIPVRPSLQDQAKWHPDSRGHEPQAAADILDRSRVTLAAQPNFCFQAAWRPDRAAPRGL